MKVFRLFYKPFFYGIFSTPLEILNNKICAQKANTNEKAA